MPPTLGKGSKEALPGLLWKDINCFPKAPPAPHSITLETRLQHVNPGVAEAQSRYISLEPNSAWTSVSARWAVPPSPDAPALPGKETQWPGQCLCFCSASGQRLEVLPERGRNPILPATLEERGGPGPTAVGGFQRECAAGTPELLSSSLVPLGACHPRVPSLLGPRTPQCCPQI